MENFEVVSLVFAFFCFCRRTSSQILFFPFHF